jgi:hypothetical protein
MQKLDFPNFNFRFQKKEATIFIFDEIRKKFIVLTPEEWVRQHVIHFLVYQKKYPKSLISVEKMILINGLKKRYDVVVYNANGQVLILVECKAPHIKTAQDTFDQIARYNKALNAPFLMVTNGLNHYFCKMDFDNECYIFIKNLPDFDV